MDPQGTFSLLQRAEHQWLDPPEASRLKSRAGTASSPHPRSPKTKGHWGADEKDSEPISKSPPQPPHLPDSRPLPAFLVNFVTAVAPLQLAPSATQFLPLSPCPQLRLLPWLPSPPMAAPNDPQALLWQRPHPREAFLV